MASTQAEYSEWRDEIWLAWDLVKRSPRMSIPHYGSRQTLARKKIIGGAPGQRSLLQSPLTASLARIILFQLIAEGNRYLITYRPTRDRILIWSGRGNKVPHLRIY